MWFSRGDRTQEPVTPAPCRRDASESPTAGPPFENHAILGQALTKHDRHERNNNASAIFTVWSDFAANRRCAEPSFSANIPSTNQRVDNERSSCHEIHLATHRAAGSRAFQGIRRDPRHGPRQVGKTTMLEITHAGVVQSLRLSSTTSTNGNSPRPIRRCSSNGIPPPF
jgi:hypothetical protein